MNKHHSSSTTATVVSMWGAMLGGAIGASIGLFGGGILISLVMGFIGGFMCSVITVSGLLAVSYLIASMIGSEFEDTPIGFLTTSQFSGILGGIGGAIGAIVLSYFGMSRLQARSGAFAVCWSITAFLPIVMAVIMVKIARYAETHPEGPAWMRPFLVRGAKVYEQIKAWRDR